MTAARANQIQTDQLPELLSLIKGADSVELKLTVPDSDRRSTIRSLGIDPLQAQVRQVVFFDTPALDLDRQGVVVRARRVQGDNGDSVVKLRPVVPSALPAELRRDASFGVEVELLPGGFVCSGSLKGKLDNDDVLQVVPWPAADQQAVHEGSAGARRDPHRRLRRSRQLVRARPDLRTQGQVRPRGIRAQDGRRSGGCTRTGRGSSSCPPSACPARRSRSLPRPRRSWSSAASI